MSKSTNIAKTGRYTKEEKTEIVKNIYDFMKIDRIEYSYDDGDEVRISKTNLSKTKRDWLTCMCKEIYQQSNILSYGINTKASSTQQVSHRNRTAQGEKVC